MKRTDARAVWMTGFGAFEDVETNPSGLLAERLEVTPPPGWKVRALRLPVSFLRAPRAIDQWFDDLQGEGDGPRLVIGMGVQKEDSFRFETRAHRRLTIDHRPDVDGVVAADGCDDAVGDEPLLASGISFDGVLERLDGKAYPIRTSDDAGGYVCERVYHHLLARSRSAATPCFFLHLPPLRFRALDEQERFLRHFFERVEPAQLS